MASKWENACVLDPNKARWQGPSLASALVATADAAAVLIAVTSCASEMLNMLPVSASKRIVTPWCAAFPIDLF